MMRFDPTAPALSLAGLDEPDCPACASGWHTHCRRAELADDGDSGELVERCCDGLLVARRRRPWWSR